MLLSLLVGIQKINLLKHPPVLFLNLSSLSPGVLTLPSFCNIISASTSITIFPPLPIFYAHKKLTTYDHTLQFLPFKALRLFRGILIDKSSTILTSNTTYEMKTFPFSLTVQHTPGCALRTIHFSFHNMIKFLSLRQFICLSVHLSISLFIYLYMYPSACLLICVLFYLYIYIKLFIYLFI